MGKKANRFFRNLGRELKTIERKAGNTLKGAGREIKDIGGAIGKGGLGLANSVLDIPKQMLSTVGNTLNNPFFLIAGAVVVVVVVSNMGSKNPAIAIPSRING